MRHPHVFPGNLDGTLPIWEYHSQFLSLAEEKAALVKETQALIGRYAGARAARISGVLAEYGQTVDSDPHEFELYHLTLDQGLYLAEILRHWIKLGIPLAENQNLIDYFPLPPPPGVQQDGYNGDRSSSSFVAGHKGLTLRVYLDLNGVAKVRLVA